AVGRARAGHLARDGAAGARDRDRRRLRPIDLERRRGDGARCARDAQDHRRAGEGRRRAHVHARPVQAGGVSDTVSHDVAPDGHDRAALLDVFVREAWETLWTLAAGARQLATRAAVTGAPYDLPIVAHRLRGSAALYGFPALSEVAGLLEEFLARLRTATADEYRRAPELLAGFVELLRTTLKRI